MELWNYCAICGRRIEVGETCYGVTKSGADLVVGDSICRDCIEIENHPNNTETNADRIRSMSDDELAKWMDNFFWGHTKANFFNLLKWLRQPADETTL